MLTIDVVALIDRINKLEAANGELRDIIKQNKKELEDSIEETRQSVVDAVPSLKEGKLVFESYDDNGNLVYGHVIAELKSDQSDAS